MSRPQHQYAEGTFGHYLQSEKGFEAGPRGLPLRVREMARRLHASPEKVAPNSPMLPGLAEALHVPLSVVQAYAKAEPMTEKWLKKISHQLANGTIPRGKKHRTAMLKKRAERSRPVPASGKPIEVQPHTKHELTRLAAAKGMRLNDLAEKIGTRAGNVWAIATGNCSPDHPLLPKIAKVLDLPLDRLQAMCKRPGFKHTKAKGKVLAVVRVPRGHALPEHNGNGKHHEKEGGGARKYNKMRKQDIDLRQAARTILTTLNETVMRGEPWTPPIATEALYAVMVDYMNAKGGRGGTLVLDPRFSEFFDPKRSG